MGRSFTNINSKINFGKNISLNNVHKFLWAGWIYTPDTNTYNRTLWHKGPKRIYFTKNYGIKTISEFSDVYRSQNKEVETEDNIFEPGEWWFIAIVDYSYYNPPRIYGARAGEQITEFAYQSSTNGIGIPVDDSDYSYILGNSDLSGNNFNGTISNLIHISLESNALFKLNHLNTLMNGGKNVIFRTENNKLYPEVHTVDYLLFSPLIGETPEPDYSGNKFNGTVTNTPIGQSPPIY